MSLQVCEHVVGATSSGEPLPPSLTARMIKYMVLKKRCKEVAEKKALTEVSIAKAVFVLKTVISFLW